LRRKKNDAIALHADPYLDRHSESNDLPKWHGTAVGIDISLDSTNEFNSLLDLIRDAYTKAVRERKVERYRKAKIYLV